LGGTKNNVAIHLIRVKGSHAEKSTVIKKSLLSQMQTLYFSDNCVPINAGYSSAG